MRRACASSLMAVLLIAAMWPASSASMPRAHADRVVSCRNTLVVYGLIFVTSARNMSCASAIREERTTMHGSLRRTKHGFVCRPLDRRNDHWRCVKGNRAYRWEYGV
jgi:hypothetical protein